MTKNRIFKLVKEIKRDDGYTVGSRVSGRTLPDQSITTTLEQAIDSLFVCDLRVIPLITPFIKLAEAMYDTLDKNIPKSVWDK